MDGMSKVPPPRDLSPQKGGREQIYSPSQEGREEIYPAPRRGEGRMLFLPTRGGDGGFDHLPWSVPGSGSVLDRNGEM